MFQYRRRIPVVCRANYGGKPFFVRSLGRNTNDLARLASQLTAQLDGEWDAIRLMTAGSQGKRDGSESATPAPSPVESLPWVRLTESATCRLQGVGTTRASETLAYHGTYETVEVSGNMRSGLLLTDAMKLYLSHHSKGDQRKFRADTERVIAMVTAEAGDLPLGAYTRQHAERFRDSLLARNSMGTVRRRLDVVVAVINKARKEKQLRILNPFDNLGIPREGEDAKEREPYTNAELKIIAEACRRLNDDIRHIIAMQLDTGARASEIIGLRYDDVVLDHAVPHVHIRPHGTVRTLKTKASQRAIPLIGEALWAAQQAVEANSKGKTASGWLFSRYSSDTEIKATHASNTLNKWLSGLPGINPTKTTHCLRHAMRDRLRAAQVPHDIQETIGGWGTRTVGQGYGRGYAIETLAPFMMAVVLPSTG